MSDIASLVDSLRHRPVATTAAQMREAADLIDSLTHERDAIAKERDRYREALDKVRCELLGVGPKSSLAFHRMGIDSALNMICAALTPKDAEGRNT